MMSPYKYSKSNKVFLVVVFLGWLTLVILGPPKTAYEVGERFGTMASLWLVPTFFSCLLWLIFRRNQSVLSITFNVVLALALMGQLSMMSQRVATATALENLQAEQRMLKATLEGAANDPETTDKARQGYFKQVGSTFEKLAGASHGKEAEFYRILQAFSQKVQEAQTKWSDAANAVMDETILDVSRLTDQQEFVRQRGVVNHYISKTQDYRRVNANMVSDFATALAPLGADFSLAVGALKGAKTKMEIQGPVTFLLLDHHVTYGQLIIQILTHLDDTKTSWIATDGKIEFRNVEHQNKYDALMGELSATQTDINVLVEKLVKLM